MPVQNKDIHTQVALVLQEMKHVNGKLDDLDIWVKKNVVTQKEFAPVQKIVYGSVTFVLMSVAGSIVALVVNVT